MTTTIIAIACLVALVITQGLVAFALVRANADRSKRKKVIRTRL